MVKHAVYHLGAPKTHSVKKILQPSKKVMFFIPLLLATCQETRNLYRSMQCCSSAPSYDIDQRILRSSESSFENVTFYNPKYIMTSYANIPIRVAYYDEGDSNSGPTILMLHGTPSWSYLYRKMMPILIDSGYRVVAIDLPGAGRSDKLIDWYEYSYKRHVETLLDVVKRLDLYNIVLVGQDWGGLYALRLPHYIGERVSALVIMNTGLPIGCTSLSCTTPTETPELFATWVSSSESAYAGKPNPLNINNPSDVFRLSSSAAITMTPEDFAAYDAPFREDRRMLGWAFHVPKQVPMNQFDPEARTNLHIWQETLSVWEKPAIALFTLDPITGALFDFVVTNIPGTKGQNSTQFTDSTSHFLQEDKGPELANKIVSFLKT